MNRKKTLLIGLSCFISLGVASGYLLKIRSLRNEIVNINESVSILTAAMSMRIGDKITQDTFKLTQIPVVHLPRRVIIAEDINLILDRPLIHPIPKGDPVLWTDLPEGPRINYPSERIKPGYRAIALPADETRTLTHLLTPGDRVDLVWTRINDTSNTTINSLIAESVTVLAVGNRFSPEEFISSDSNFPSSITLLVKPDQALAINYAFQVGDISLLARTRSDLSTSNKRSRDNPAGIPAAGENL